MKDFLHLELVRLERMLQCANSENEKERIEAQITNTMNRAGLATAEQIKDDSFGRYGGVFGYDGEKSHLPTRR